MSESDLKSCALSQDLKIELGVICLAVEMNIGFSKYMAKLRK